MHICNGNCEKYVSIINLDLKYQRAKDSEFIYPYLQGNPNSSGLQFEVAYWPALAAGGAAQLAAAHCPNERTLDPQKQLDRPTYAQTAALWPSSRNVLQQRLNYF